MIISAEELLLMDEFSGESKEALERKLVAVEKLIRSYTNNNFQNRNIRFSGYSHSNKIYGYNPYFKSNDTIQISSSLVNDGLYTINEITDDYIAINAELFDVEKNLVTKIEYPDDIVQGVISLMIWEVNNRNKVGIKSESISRHNVTYFDQDANNSVMGYPVSLLGFLKPYMKARF